MIRRLVLGALALVLLAGLLGALALFQLRGIVMPPVSVYKLGELELPKLPITLTEVAGGFDQPTEIEFVPGEPDRLVVLEKAGSAFWLDLATGERGRLFEADVVHLNEQGLLGIAFHPEYPAVPCFYVNYTASSERPDSGSSHPEGERDRSKVVEYCGREGASIDALSPEPARTVMTLEQPFSNHNAGQLLFGPEGHLWIPWGDGESGDPGDNAQDPTNFLGTVLRISLTPPGTAGPAYVVPADNPFVGDPAVADEVFAYGFRNPWRGAFDADWRLVVGDVGQHLWEEIDVVERGRNYGWRRREGKACYPPGEPCAGDGFEDPIYEYPHSVGLGVIGGAFWGSSHFPELEGRFLFADYVTGFVRSLRVPDRPGEPVDVLTHGTWPINPVDFARDPSGSVYLVEQREGRIYRISPPTDAPLWDRVLYHTKTWLKDWRDRLRS